MYKSVVKRVLDFLLALAGTIVLSPLLLVLAGVGQAGFQGPCLFPPEKGGPRQASVQHS